MINLLVKAVAIHFNRFRTFRYTVKLLIQSLHHSACIYELCIRDLWIVVSLMTADWAVTVSFKILCHLPCSEIHVRLYKFSAVNLDNP